MQKVLRATDRAKTQAKRKVLAQRQKAGRLNRVLLEQQKLLSQKEVTADIRAARTTRKEDWLLGSLSPRRDAGSSTDSYGTVSVRRLNGVNKPGKCRDFCIAEGDRVVIVGKGLRDQGKIGVVQSVAFKAEACTVKGLNRVCSMPFSILIEIAGVLPTVMVLLIYWCRLTLPHLNTFEKLKTINGRSELWNYPFPYPPFA